MLRIVFEDKLRSSYCQKYCMCCAVHECDVMNVMKQFYFYLFLINVFSYLLIISFKARSYPALRYDYPQHFFFFYKILFIARTKYQEDIDKYVENYLRCLVFVF